MDRKLLEKELETRLENKTIHFSKATKKAVLDAKLENYKKRNIDEFYSVVMEECGELIQRVSKLLRGKIELNDIGLLEEIVDVELSIKMLKQQMGIDKDTLKYIEDIKLDRLLENLQKGEL